MLGNLCIAILFYCQMALAVPSTRNSQRKLQRREKALVRHERHINLLEAEK